MTSYFPKTKFSNLLAIALSMFLIYGVGSGSALKAESLEFVRIIDTDDLFNREFFSAGNPDLSGIGFPPGAHTLLVLNQPWGASLDLVSPPKNINSSIVRTSIDIPDPINITFDMKSMGVKGHKVFRLFLWDSDHNELISIKAGPRNVMNPKSIRRFNLQSAGLTNNPQGMTLDPTTNILYLMDGSGQQIIGIQPKRGRKFKNGEISQIIDIPFYIAGGLRGLAYNASNKHLYTMSSGKQKLYKFNLNGNLISSINLSGLNIGVLEGMVFGPSLDRTDLVSVYHLYLVSTQNTKSEITEWSLR
jgi:hypothetical protein